MTLALKLIKTQDRDVRFLFLNVSSLVLEIIIILAITWVKNIFRLLVVAMVLQRTEGGWEINVIQEGDGG